MDQQKRLVDYFVNSENASHDVNQLLDRYVSTDGAVMGWGNSKSGELGVGTRTNLTTPLVIGGPDKPLRIACTTASSVWVGVHCIVSSMGSGIWGTLGVGDLTKCPRVSFTESGEPIAVIQVEIPMLQESGVIVDVQGGHAFFAALSVSGEVFLWGANNYGQCTPMLQYARVGVPQRRQLPEGEKVMQLACANYTVFALTTTQQVYGWGFTVLLGEERDLRAQTEERHFTQVQIGKEKPRTVVLEPVLFKALSGFSITSIRAGPWHAAAVTTTGKVYTWGIGKNGRLGHGDEEDVFVPTQISTFGTPVVDVICGSFHTCFITGDGAAYACGDNQAGQCGAFGEFMLTKCERIFVPGNRHVISAICGRHHTILLLDSGDALAYGSGLGIGVGLGRGIRMVRAAPILQGYITLMMRGGTRHGFALTVPRNLMMLMIGVQHRGLCCLFKRINLKDGLLNASVGQGFSILLNRRGSCYSMGLGGWGQLGVDPHAVKECTKEKVPVLRQATRVHYLSRTCITYVSAGISFAAAISEGQRLFTWGSNKFGQCGLGVDPRQVERVTEPREVTWLADKLIVQVACGCYFALALTATGEVYSWGAIECCGNGLQPLEDIVPKQVIMENISSESRASILMPVRVAGMSGIVAIATGAWHALALSALGDVFAWGVGACGRLGYGKEEDRYTPTKITIPGITVKIGCAPFASFAITDDAKLFVWGENERRQLSTEGKVLTPRRVLDNVSECAMGKYYSLALLHSGDVLFSGNLEQETVKGEKYYSVSKSFHDAEAQPAELRRETLERDGLRAVRIFAGPEHGFVLAEQNGIAARTIAATQKFLRDQPAEIIKRGTGTSL